MVSFGDSVYLWDEQQLQQVYLPGAYFRLDIFSECFVPPETLLPTNDGLYG